MCNGGRSTFSAGDNLASEIVAKLWLAGGFHWELDRVRAFAGGCVRNMIREMQRSKTKAFADFETEEGFNPIELAMVSLDDPHRSALATEALAMLKHLPNEQRDALAILVDGGSPIDVAIEMKIDIRAAVQLVKDARRNIHLVANDDDY